MKVKKSMLFLIIPLLINSCNLKPTPIENAIVDVKYFYSQKDIDYLISKKESIAVMMFCFEVRPKINEIIVNDPSLTQYFNSIEIYEEKEKCKLLFTSLYRKEKGLKINLNEQIKKIKK